MTGPRLFPGWGILLIDVVLSLLALTTAYLLRFNFQVPEQEVDLLLEAPGQRIAGIEIKASANVGQGDFAGLRALAEAAGKNFSCGVALYLGEQRLPFGDNLWALPISALWE